MKDEVFIVNTARGELIDIEDLYNNLKTGKVRGAALDIMECESLTLFQRKDEANPKCADIVNITKKLFSMPNVIITPHIAYNTYETVNYLLEATFNNIRDNLKGMSSDRVC